MGFFIENCFRAVIGSNIFESFVRAVCSSAAAVFITFYCSLLATATTVHPAAFGR
jgi:hypothetical protein